MILALCFRLAACIHLYLYVYAPSDILIRYLRSSTGGRWAFPISAALSAGYLAATTRLTSILEPGGPGWLNLVTLFCAWKAVKFVVMGVLSACRCCFGPRYATTGPSVSLEKWSDLHREEHRAWRKRSSVGPWALGSMLRPGCATSRNCSHRL